MGHSKKLAKLVLLLGIGVAADFGDREGVVVLLHGTTEVSSIAFENSQAQIITQLREQNAKLVLENAKLAAMAISTAVPTDGPRQVLSLEALQAQWRSWHTDLCSDTKPGPADAPPVLIEEHHDQYAVTPYHTIQCHRPKDSEDNGDATQRVVIPIIEHIHNLTGSLGMNYSLAYGTMLGAYRHHGFIPWDNDADVQMLAGDIARLTLALSQSATGKGPKLYIPKYMQWIVRSGQDSDIIAIKVADARTGYYVDVFAVDLEGDKACYPMCLQHTPGCRCMPASWVYPVQACQFGRTAAYCVNEPKKYLVNMYGDIGIHGAFGGHRHSTEGIVTFAGILAPKLP